MRILRYIKSDNRPVNWDDIDILFLADPSTHSVMTYFVFTCSCGQGWTYEQPSDSIAMTRYWHPEIQSDEDLWKHFSKQFSHCDHVKGTLYY